MTQKHRVVRNRRGGFTLLEILLVVGLLALLASFVVPALTTQSERAKVEIANMAIRPNGELSRVIDLFQINTGVFPEELKYLVEKPEDEEIAKKWAGPYIKDVSGLLDPWGHEYQYTQEGQHNEKGYDLWSMGPDGQDGTDDDVKNWKDDRG